ncbi:hypothetical protein VTO73DRAFT_10731 [Trametes versicolor]
MSRPALRGPPTPFRPILLDVAHAILARYSPYKTSKIGPSHSVAHTLKHDDPPPFHPTVAQTCRREHRASFPTAFERGDALSVFAVSSRSARATSPRPPLRPGARRDAVARCGWVRRVPAQAFSSCFPDLTVFTAGSRWPFRPILHDMAHAALARYLVILWSNIDSAPRLRTEPRPKLDDRLLELGRAYPASTPSGTSPFSWPPHAVHTPQIVPP